MIAIKIGTVSWRRTETLDAGEVAFDGSFLYKADGFTPAMVWDNAIGNVRPKTAQELAADQALVDAETADRQTWQAERADFQSQLATAATRLEQIRDAASPNNAQVIAAMRDMAQIQLRMLKYIRRL